MSRAEQSSGGDVEDSGRNITAHQASHANPVPRAEEDVPQGQRYFDNIWLLLVAGLVVMFVFYTIWGMIEIYTLPQATLP